MKREKSPRYYDEEFKINAVRLWQESGKKQREFEAEMGIGSGNISHWKRQYAEQLGEEVTQPIKNDPEQEIKRLRKENALLKEEREILKKAMGIFSQPLR